MLAMNHWSKAIETHNSNFQNTTHVCTDISATDPRRYPSTDFMIASPECTNHSLAKGVKRKHTPQMGMFDSKWQPDPSEERSRATMWDVPRFAEVHGYNVIIVENVVDARHWTMWDAWLHAMDLLGYDHRVVYFNSMFAHPTPQSRDRMYVVFWRKGNCAPDLDFHPGAYCHRCEQDVAAVQVWKKRGKSWGKYRTQYVYACPACAQQVEPYYYAAANAIDWTLPAPRIGDRKKPLRDKTRARIQVGLERFARPFLYDTVHTAREDRHQDMVWPADGAGRTQLGASTHGLVVPPHVVNLAYTHAKNVRSSSLDEPMPTRTGWQTFGVVVPPYIVTLHGMSQVASLAQPLPTQLGNVHHGVSVPPFIVDLRGENAPKGLDDTISTICASGNHHALVLPFLTSYYGTNEGAPVDGPVPTVTTVDRHALVVPPFVMGLHTAATYRQMSETLQTVVGEGNHHFLVRPDQLPTVDDCGFRMLQPHEIQKAMAFPDDYIILGNAKEKVKQLGNAVTPPVMKMLMERCVETFN